MDTSKVQSLGVTDNSLFGDKSAQPAMGKEDFLKLLVAQLSHQDPLQPMENSEFVAQLAQFSGVEQMMNVNDNLSLIQAAQLSTNNGQMASLIGKEVEVKGDQLVHQQAGPDRINFDLDGQAQEVTVKVLDKQGKLVRTIALGPHGPGLNTVGWDGRDELGNMAQPGTYSIQIEAKDANGAGVTASTRYRGTVSGVTFSGGVPLLEIGQATIALGDVLAVRSASTSNGTANGTP